MGRYNKLIQHNLMKIGAFIISEAFKIALKLGAKMMRRLINIYDIRKLGGSDTPPQFFPLGACAKGLPPLSPLIGASPRCSEISRRFS